MAWCFAYLSQRNNKGLRALGNTKRSEELRHREHPAPRRIESRRTSGPLKNWVTENIRSPEELNHGKHTAPEELSHGEHPVPWRTESRGTPGPLKNWVTGNIWSHVEPSHGNIRSPEEPSHGNFRPPEELRHGEHLVPCRTESREHPVLWRTESRGTSGPLKSWVTGTSGPLKNWITGNVRSPEEFSYLHKRGYFVKRKFYKAPFYQMLADFLKSFAFRKVSGFAFFFFEVRHPRCVGSITKNFCVLHIQFNTTIFHPIVQ